MSSFLEEVETESPSSAASSHSLWVERYRPDRLDNYIGNDDLKTKVKQFIDAKDIPHLLFYGGPGTGKTTLAKLITNAIDCDVLYVNASSENRIDDIRIKVTNFASTLGFKELKVIILDECLDENTKIWVFRDGKETSIPIKEANDKTDLVKSYNVKVGRVEWMPFCLFDKGEQEVMEIVLENGEVVVCTFDHKWYVEENGVPIVVKAKDLHKYNHILSP